MVKLSFTIYAIFVASVIHCSTANDGVCKNLSSSKPNVLSSAPSLIVILANFSSNLLNGNNTAVATTLNIV